MKQWPRIYHTESQKALMWERWRKGESLQRIAQLFDRNHSSIQQILAETDGIQPVPRCRSRLALTFTEREEVSRGLIADHSIRSIATRLKRAHSTICREVHRIIVSAWQIVPREAEHFVLTPVNWQTIETYRT